MKFSWFSGVTDTCMCKQKYITEVDFGVVLVTSTHVLAGNSTIVSHALRPWLHVPLSEQHWQDKDYDQHSSIQAETSKMADKIIQAHLDHSLWSFQRL